MAGVGAHPRGPAVGNRSLRAPLLAAVIGVTMVADCKVVIAVPTAPPTAAPSATLACIGDEGQVTYSITFTHCRCRHQLADCGGPARPELNARTKEGRSPRRERPSPHGRGASHLRRRSRA